MCQKLINTARKYINTDNKNLHVSILTHKNKIIEVKGNNYNKTDSFGVYYKYQYGYIHSELAVIKAARFYKHLDKCTLYNFRFSRKGLGTLLSMPCVQCMNLINTFGIKEVIYTTGYGFGKLINGNRH